MRRIRKLLKFVLLGREDGLRAPQLWIDFTPVPEPAVGLPAAAAGLALLVWRRRREGR